MLQLVYGDETMARSSVLEWHERFRDGLEEVEDAPRGGRQSTSRTEENVDRVRQIIRNDRRLTARIIADSLSINRDCVWKIITEDLGMRKICAKMVPKLLKDGQKERRVQVCEDIIERLKTEPNLLAKVITGDESSVFEYDPETKHQSCQWKSPGSPRPQKARQSRSKMKLVLIAFFDIRAEFLPLGQTVNQHVYKELLRRLFRSVREKRLVAGQLVDASS